MSSEKFHGARLRLARTFHGLTLAELGEKVSVSRQYIQKLENEAGLSPSRDMIFALAEILDVEPAFFFEAIIGDVTEEECHFRKRQTTPLNIRNRALSYGTIFNFIISYLDQELDLPVLDIPTLEVKNREDIERAAEKCRERWQLSLDAPIDNVTRTLERVGCVVTTFEGVSDKIDAFSYVRHRPVIVRNIIKHSSSRARFDLAHECGHLVMHSNIEVGDPILEEEANNFASAFLLPRKAFADEFPSAKRLNWMKLFELKKRWGASVQAIIKRAYDLGLISAVQYRNAYVYISRNGWRHGEPPKTEPPFEPGEIIPKALQLLKRERNITVNRIAKKLHVGCGVLANFEIKCDEPEKKNLEEEISVNDHPQKRIKISFN